MKSGVMGAALLAAVSAFALAGEAQRAEAAAVFENIELNTSGGSVSLASYPMKSFSNNISGYFNYDPEQTFHGSGGSASYTITDLNNGTYKLDFGISSDSKLFQDYCEGNVCGQEYLYFQAYGTVITSQSISYESPFTLLGTDVVSSYVGSNVFETGYDPGPYFYQPFGSDPQLLSFSVISAVPLPASAPLFGAGLLMVAGIRYGARRAKTA